MTSKHLFFTCTLIIRKKNNNNNFEKKGKWTNPFFVLHNIYETHTKYASVVWDGCSIFDI